MPRGCRGGSPRESRGVWGAARPQRDPNQNFSNLFFNLNFFFYLKCLKIQVFEIFGGNPRISHIFLLQNAIRNAFGDALEVHLQNFGSW